MTGPEWSGSVGEDGPGQILYSRERALVRVHGVDYAIPKDDRVLIVLVDETATNVMASVRTHAVLAPTTTWARVDPQADRAERLRLRGEQVRAASTTWHTWFENEPFIRAFVAEKGDA